MFLYIFVVFCFPAFHVFVALRFLPISPMFHFSREGRLNAKMLLFVFVFQVSKFSMILGKAVLYSSVCVQDLSFFFVFSIVQPLVPSFDTEPDMKLQHFSISFQTPFLEVLGLILTPRWCYVGYFGATMANLVP